jgi:MFS family permease
MHAPADARAALLREPNFRCTLAGGAISTLGDQFTLIALPWLVLTTTGDPLTMGLVIALMSVPRAVFILIGGALVDRYSPKSVLMLTKHANTVLIGALAALVFAGQASLPLICVLALGIGLASAFSIPSGTSMLPHVVAPAHLPLANGIMMGMRQAALLAGPLLAALLFFVFGDGSAGQAGRSSMHGIGAAFALDAATFLLSAWTLAKVQLLHAPAKAAPEPVLRAVKSGLAMVWNDVALRTCMLYWALCAFAAGGSMQVALPVLADTRLGGAGALGLILGVHGAGTLLGMAVTGGTGASRLRNFGTTVLVADLVAGLLLLPLGQVDAVWQAALLLLPLGMLAGFLQVAVFSWIQQRVPRAMLGRAMSIFMFIFLGVAPLSAAVTGWALQYLALGQLFAGAGLFLIATASLAFLLTPMRHIGDGAAAGPEQSGLG